MRPTGGLVGHQQSVMTARIHAANGGRSVAAQPVGVQPFALRAGVQVRQIVSSSQSPAAGSSACSAVYCHVFFFCCCWREMVVFLWHASLDYVLLCNYIYGEPASSPSSTVGAGAQTAGTAFWPSTDISSPASTIAGRGVPAAAQSAASTGKWASSPRPTRPRPCGRSSRSGPMSIRSGSGSGGGAAAAR